MSEMTYAEELVLTVVMTTVLAWAAVCVFVGWRRRPRIGWDPEQLRWRSARLIYKERRWR